MSWSNDSFYDFFGSTSDGVMAPMLPQNLNPECTRPNQWTTKSPGETCVWKSQKLDEFTGLPQKEKMIMYPSRNPKITGPLKAPSITFTKLEGIFPPAIRCLVFDEESSARLIAHHDDPLFLPPPTKEERKAYLTILYDVNFERLTLLGAQLLILVCFVDPTHRSFLGDNSKISSRRKVPHSRRTRHCRCERSMGHLG